MSAFTRSILVFLIFGLLLSAPLQAKIRKCVLSNGHIIFTDIACPEKARPSDQVKIEKTIDPFAGMNDAQRERAEIKRDRKWEISSKSACLNNIDSFAKTLQPNFLNIIVKNQHKLVTRSNSGENPEYVHRVSFFFMADGTEWESSGNCHATLSNNTWKTDFQRITTGMPFISAQKKSPKKDLDKELVKKNDPKTTPEVTASSKDK